MFEAAELDQKMSKKAYDSREPKLRADLLNTHFALRDQKFPVIVIISGADGAGKGELVHRLNEWLDPRGVETHAFWKPSEEECERPSYWRFWRAMPGKGRIGIMFGSWYSEPIVRRVYGQTKTSQLDTALDRIASFEKMLTDDGALIVKFWMHLPKKAQRKALKKLEESGRVTPTDWKHFKMYDRFRKVSERALRHTDSAAAPWHIIEATDRRHRECAVATILRDAIRKRIKQAAAKAAAKAASKHAPAPSTPSDITEISHDKSGSILAHVDLTQTLTEARYKKELAAHQKHLSKLAWAAHAKKRSMVMVFEGWDAAGKGSAIRRVTQAIDPRLYRVVGIAAPTDEERAQHYLWRFWRHLPRGGFTTIFDRSWYGRVLVERVEGFAPVADWSRGFHEINEFEEQLSEQGVVVNKFWVHISAEEQLRRFKDRQKIAYKQYKITDEDWRNRKKWDGYELAVNEMVARTSTEFAPWTIVAGNDKKFARIQILKTVCQRLEEAL